MRNVHGEIESLLRRIEARHGIRILYACESGSRAWGFASPDSDYDIRFLFVRPESAYLSVEEGTEAITLPLEGDLDAAGWDVRKAAALLGKSNGALMEWLQSPIIYREEPGFLDAWKSTANLVYHPKPCSDHYRGLAAGMWHRNLSGDQVRAKDYLYALRAVLAAMWALDGKGVPPVPFTSLLEAAPPAIRDLVPALLAHKASTGEGERMPRIADLDVFLQTSLQHSSSQSAALPQSKSQPRLLDALLRRTVRGFAPVPTPPSLTLDRIKQSDMLLFDTVAGSHAYGTAIASSDEDRRGIFVAPRAFLLGLDEIEQVSDSRHDQTYYEIGKWVELLLKNNPNALELLGMPDDCVRHCHPIFRSFQATDFLSKRCAQTFGEYAMGQIRKARGLNKKIVNPQPENRRPLLDFCRIPEGQGSIGVVEWLAIRGLEAKACGLTAVQGTFGVYAIYHDPSGSLRGLVSPKDPDALVFSSVPKEAVPLAWMHCNHDAFQAHCKAHREYWEWVALRNEERYTTNAGHGRGYDSKNLMHTHRLLEMALEIAREGTLRVRRPNRDLLLRIRAGEYDYETLVCQAEELLLEVHEAFAASPLPDEPDRAKANRLLVEARDEFWSGVFPASWRSDSPSSQP
ncbi:MAG: nucleotidyltransferase domain-containing protein [Akkermansiaceae bacterium]|jgi:predicted nucleotidyltransferase|nr:nucleotidyltransferase domain-containing protein [Akkermansiaceae bacterium]